MDTTATERKPKTNSQTDNNPQEAYQNLIANDKTKPPKDLLENAYTDLGLEGIDISRYTTPEFHRLEMEKSIFIKSIMHSDFNYAAVNLFKC